MNEKRDSMLGEIRALKSLLADTDYMCLKYAEGALTESEFSEIKARRAGWRAKINELEIELDKLRPAEPPEEDAPAEQEPTEGETEPEPSEFERETKEVVDVEPETDGETDNNTKED